VGLHISEQRKISCLCLASNSDLSVVRRHM
jgi:hypothetical protein